MKSEKTTGAKIRAFDTRAYYASLLDEREAAQPPKAPVFAGGFYVVAIDETTDPERKTVYATAKSADVRGYNPETARDFDTYGDALKWMVENCEIPALDFVAMPRGFERPRFPRVCYVRKYTEVETL